MSRHEIENLADLSQGQCKLVETDGEKYLVYHLSDGYFATTPKCTHLFKSLEKGKIIDDKVIQCPLHRAEFDIRTGEVEKWACFPPGVQVLNVVRSEKALGSYKVVEQDGKFYIES